MNANMLINVDTGGHYYMKLSLVLHLRNIPYNPRGALILTFDIGRGVLQGHFKLG